MGQKEKKKARHLLLRVEKCQGEGGKRTLQSPVLGENARVEGAESRKPRRSSGSSAFLIRFGFLKTEEEEERELLEKLCSQQSPARERRRQREEGGREGGELVG